jgi:hypothetical protein
MASLDSNELFEQCSVLLSAAVAVAAAVVVCRVVVGGVLLCVCVVGCWWCVGVWSCFWGAAFCNLCAWLPNFLLFPCIFIFLFEKYLVLKYSHKGKCSNNTQQ